MDDDTRQRFREELFEAAEDVHAVVGQLMPTADEVAEHLDAEISDEELLEETIATERAILAQLAPQVRDEVRD